MLDADYRRDVAMQRLYSQEINNDSQTTIDDVIREIILPEIEKEVNTGKNFATLRQIYHSLILAKWYKQTVKNSIMSQVYVDQNKTAGIEVAEQGMKEEIYDRYMQAYQKGVFNYIKEDYDALSETVIPRQYFSGGFIDSGVTVKSDDNALKVVQVKVGDEHRLFVNVKPEIDSQNNSDEAMLSSFKEIIPGTLEWKIRQLEIQKKIKQIVMQNLKFLKSVFTQNTAVEIKEEQRAATQNFDGHIVSYGKPEFVSKQEIFIGQQTLEEAEEAGLFSHEDDSEYDEYNEFSKIYHYSYYLKQEVDADKLLKFIGTLTIENVDEKINELKASRGLDASDHAMLSATPEDAIAYQQETRQRFESFHQQAHEAFFNVSDPEKSAFAPGSRVLQESLFHHIPVTGHADIRQVYQQTQEILHDVLGGQGGVIDMDLNEIHVTIANDDIDAPEKFFLTLDQLFKEVSADAENVAPFSITLIGPRLMKNGVVVMEFTTDAPEFLHLRRKAEQRINERKQKKQLSATNRAFAPNIIHSTVSDLRDANITYRQLQEIFEQFNKYRAKLAPISFEVKQVVATRFDEAERRFKASRVILLEDHAILSRKDIVADFLRKRAVAGLHTTTGSRQYGKALQGKGNAYVTDFLSNLAKHLINGGIIPVFDHAESFQRVKSAFPQATIGYFVHNNEAEVEHALGLGANVLFGVDENLSVDLIEKIKRMRSDVVVIASADYQRSDLNNYLKSLVEAGVDGIQVKPFKDAVLDSSNFLELRPEFSALIEELRSIKPDILIMGAGGIFQDRLNNVLKMKEGIIPAIGFVAPDTGNLDIYHEIFLRQVQENQVRIVSARDQAMLSERAGIKQRLIDRAQQYIDLISQGDDFLPNVNAFLVLGNPDIMSMIHFATTWKDLQAAGKNIPIVLAGGRGRGTVPLIENTIKWYADSITEDEINYLRHPDRYESDVIRFIFQKENIPLEYIQKENTPSKTTLENFINSRDVLKQAVAGISNPVIAVTTWPPLLMRVKATAEKVWENEITESGWDVKKLQTYQLDLTSLSDTQLVQLLGYMAGYPVAYQQVYPKLSVTSELRGTQRENNLNVKTVPVSDAQWQLLSDVQTLFEQFLDVSNVTYDTSANNLSIQPANDMAGGDQAMLSSMAKVMSAGLFGAMIQSQAIAQAILGESNDGVGTWIVETLKTHPFLSGGAILVSIGIISRTIYNIDAMTHWDRKRTIIGYYDEDKEPTGHYEDPGAPLYDGQPGDVDNSYWVEDSPGHKKGDPIYDDQAMLGAIQKEAPGGIDMNEIAIDHQSSTESGNETRTIQFNMQGMEPLLNMDIQGFSPVIIDMIPINSVLPLLGLMPTEKGIKYGQEEAQQELQLSKSES